MTGENEVNQSHAQAQGDIVARDKLTNIYASRPSKIDQLVRKLKEEQESGQAIDCTIDSLKYFLTPTAEDGIVGLEAKLKHANRTSQLTKALREKELFAKFLERWSHFASAQELFAYLLANVEQRFNSYLFPNVDALSRSAFDALVFEKVIEPTLAEIGDEPLSINATVVSGMIYWLAEQCFVKWHS